MTQEEKAKAYDEAIKRAKFFKRKYHSVKDVSDCLEQIFPELKVPNDETIRQTLINFHKSTITINGIEGADIVNWLEKQGEYAKFKEYK